MNYSADFRRSARDALRGRWGLPIAAGLVASILGGAGIDGPEVKLNFEGAGVNASLEFADRTIFSTGGGLEPGLAGLAAGGAVYIAAAAIAMAVVYFILGSVIEIGYARFNLELAGGQSPSLESLFAYFSWWKTAALARFLKGLYVLLRAFPLIIPGIMASYSYAMTGYILAEHPRLSAKQAIARSKEMMAGNRFRLFCLQLSFIGWDILCSLSLGIGGLWLTPYKQAATAAFYRELSGAEGFYA